jgi:hemerythrin
MFEWKDEYSVHVISIDAQHQNLFAIARELHAAMEAGQAKSVLAKTLDRLVKYTKMHFSHEERRMQQGNYPDFPAHKAAHDALTAQVQKFQEDFQSGKIMMTIQLFQFLRDWLEKHIKVSDSKYVPYIS